MPPVEQVTLPRRPLRFTFKKLFHFVVGDVYFDVELRVFAPFKAQCAPRSVFEEGPSQLLVEAVPDSTDANIEHIVSVQGDGVNRYVFVNLRTQSINQT